MECNSSKPKAVHKEFWKQLTYLVNLSNALLSYGMPPKIQNWQLKEQWLLIWEVEGWKWGDDLVFSGFSSK